MALPMPPNTTCDIYRSGHTPPAAPDVAGVKCYLAPKGQSTLTTPQSVSSVGYTHEMSVGPTTDIRDGTSVPSLMPASGGDTVYIPNKNGTLFAVCIVRRYGRGTSVDHKRVLLQRGAISTWPTDNV